MEQYLTKPASINFLTTCHIHLVARYQLVWFDTDFFNQKVTRRSKNLLYKMMIKCGHKAATKKCEILTLV